MTGSVAPIARPYGARSQANSSLVQDRIVVCYMKLARQLAGRHDRVVDGRLSLMTTRLRGTSTLSKITPIVSLLNLDYEPHATAARCVVCPEGVASGWPGGCVEHFIEQARFLRIVLTA